MKKFFLPGTALIAVLVAVLGGAVALGAFNSDDGDGGRDAVSDEARCAEGAMDCNEGGSDAACLEGATDCDDTPGDTGGGALGMCAPGFTDCVDMVVDPDGEPPANICLEGATDCNDMPTSGECAPPEEGGDDFCNDDADAEVRVHEIILTDMETNIGSVASIVSSEYVEWPDSCLGIETAGVACAQVITPGFKVVAEAGGQQVEYHTDLAGNFTAVN